MCTLNRVYLSYQQKREILRNNKVHVQRPIENQLKFTNLFVHTLHKKILQKNKNMAESKPTYVQGLKYLRTKSYSESSGIMNFRLLTTKTNSKASYIFWVFLQPHQ